MHDNSVPEPARRVAIGPRITLALLLLGFTAAGAMRLNDCDLFNPDSPRYLIYAQSLADSGEYRAIDSPGAPLYTWRPPGLPLLLVPVLTFFPYDVVAAKSVVLGLAALMLLLVYRVTAGSGHPWAACLVAVVVATSPLFLTLSTEVLSEVPYTLGTLAALACLNRNRTADGTLRRITAVGLAAALALTPLIRTVGVSLVVALGAWGISHRTRWRVLPAVSAGAAALGVLAWRSHGAPGNNYAGSLWDTLHQQGPLQVVVDALQRLTFYVGALPGVLFPGLVVGQPFYAPLIPGSPVAVPALSGVAMAATGLVVLLGLRGMWQQRSGAGTVAVLYVALYSGCLLIWPWRHERFLWPLVPVLLAFVPAGWPARLASDGLRTARGATLTLLLVGLSLAGWQTWASSQLIAVNQQFVTDRDRFFAQQAPGFYFSDWRRAGSWIRNSTAPESRLLIWQAAVGGTAHRFQKRVQFEAITPAQVRQQIAIFGARYLVITTSQFGTGFGWQQVTADPALTLEVVYRDRDVVVLSAEPNRGGVVSRTGYHDWLTAQLNALTEFLAESPDRTDLVIRQANLLQELGEPARAITLLEELLERGVRTVRVCSSLGWLHFSEGHFARAAELLDLASGLPNAEPVAVVLQDGAQRARLRMTRPETPAERSERTLRQIRGLIDSLLFLNAERELEQALGESPQDPELNTLRGYVHHVFGERDAAVTYYKRAAAGGNARAKTLLELLDLERQLEASTASRLQSDRPPLSTQGGADAWVRYATLLTEQGWSGRAVAALESAQQSFGDDPRVLVPLAELYLQFARPDLAQSSLDRIPPESADREGIERLRAAVQAGLRVPRF